MAQDRLPSPHASAHLRHRRRPLAPSITSTQSVPKPSSPTRPARPSASPSPLRPLLLCLALSLALMVAVPILPALRIRANSRRPPTPARPFSTARAMRHVRAIAAAPRWVGTAALEDALRYIETQLLAMRPAAERHALHLEVEVFRSGPGSLYTDIAHIDLIGSYDDILSVVARLRPRSLPVDTNESALMVNAHVDSAVGSPGASDNVCGVGVAMEVLRCMVEAGERAVTRPVVFLFNGAEEAVLLGAHSFVMQHRWARPVAAHINMESLGAGGAYHLFRLGPSNAWLARAFARAVSMPSASVTASDLFDSKVIPGETDFRVFDEDAGIPGFDFVLLDNGHVYHTNRDSIANVDEYGVYHGGVMVYELATELAGQNDAIGMRESDTVHDSPLRRLSAAAVRLANVLRLVRDPENPRVAFFDVLQWKTVVYEEGVALLLNILALLFAVLVWTAKLVDMRRDGAKETIRMFFVFWGCTIASFASATFAAFLYSEILGSKLRWYGHWAMAVLLFGFPAAFGCISAMFYLLPRNLTHDRFDHMLFPLSCCQFTLAAVLTKYGYMTSYVPTSLLAATTLCVLQGESLHPVLRHFELIIAHAVIGGKLVVTSLSAMLPLLGRVRSEIVPHDVIASALVTLYTLAYFLQPSLPLLCHYAKALRKLQLLTFLGSVAIASWFVAGPLLLQPSTKQAFVNTVYSSAAPKRLMVLHFCSPEQAPQCVLLIATLDPIPSELSRIMGDDDSARNLRLPSLPLWGKLESTGIETFKPFKAFIQDVAVFRAEKPHALPLPTATVVSDEDLGTTRNVSFIVHAPRSHQLTVRFLTSHHLVLGWSLNAPLKDSADGAWIRHFGTNEFRFWLLLNKSAHTHRPKIRMAITSARLGKSFSSHLMGLRFEEWEAPTLVSSSGLEVEL